MNPYLKKILLCIALGFNSQISLSGSESDNQPVCSSLEDCAKTYLSEDFIKKYPLQLNKIAKYAQWNVFYVDNQELFLSIPTKQFEEDPNFFEEIASYAGSETPSAFKNMPLDLFYTDRKALLKLAKKHTMNVGDFFLAFGNNVSEIDKKYGSKLKSIGENAGGWLYKDHQIRFSCYNSIPKQLFFKNPEWFIQLSDYTQKDTCDTLKYITENFFLNDQSLYLAKKYGSQLSQLLYVFGEDIFNIETKYGLQLEQIAKSDNYATIFLSKQLFLKYPNALTQIALMHGKSTSSIFRKLFDSSFDLDKLVIAFKKYNISQGNNYPKEYLEEMAKSLDENYKQNFPVALLFVAKYDPNLALTGLCYMQNSFLERYKTLIYEIDNKKDLFQIIEEVGKNKKISLLIFNAHGQQNFFRLKKTENEFSEQQKQYDITVNDKPYFEQMSHSLTNNADIVLASCLTGKGRDKENNLANSMASELHGRNIFAPVDSFTNIEITFNTDASIKNVEYSVPTYIAHFPIK